MHAPLAMTHASQPAVLGGAGGCASFSLPGLIHVSHTFYKYLYSLPPSQHRTHTQLGRAFCYRAREEAQST
jgi:hypothetical protein